MSRIPPATVQALVPRPLRSRRRPLRRWLLAALCLALPAGAALALSPDQTLPQLHRTQWSLREGAPTAIRAIAQTPDGFLWLGSATGLFRFDGVRFESFDTFARPGQALRSRAVTALSVLPDGGLAVGYKFGGVSVLRPDGTLHHGADAPGVPPGSIWQMAVDKGGRLWAASGRGLVRERDGRWERVGTEAGLEAQQFYGVVVDRAGALWVSTERGVYQQATADAKFRRVAPDLSLTRAALAVAPDGRVWAFSYADESRLGPLPRPDEDPAPLKALWRDAAPVNSLNFDRDGSLWLATGDSTQRIAHPLAVAPLDSGDIATPSRNVAEMAWTTFEDREGNVWVGTNSGLERYRANKVMLVPLTHNATGIGLAPGEDGRVWLSLYGGGLQQVDSRQQPMVRMMDTPRLSWTPTFIHRDARQRVWFGGTNGLWRLDGGQVVQDRQPEGVGVNNGGMYSDVIQAFAEDGAGGQWLAVSGRGTYYRPALDADWQLMNGQRQIPKAQPLVLNADGRGRLWLGFTQNRLLRLDGDGLRHSALIDGLQVGNVLVVVPRGAQTWVAGDTGLAWIDEAGKAHAVKADAPDALFGLSGLVVTAQGDLWLNGSAGLIRIPAAEIARSLSDPAYPVRTERLDHRDGLPGQPEDLRPLPTLVQGTDGRLWASFKNGLVVLDPAHLPGNTLPPPVVVEALKTGDRTYAAAQDLTLPERSADLQIDYTALSLAVPERVNFRYRLEGVDTGWQDAGLRRTAYYTQLQPGDYTFRVAASNNDGLWNETGATLRFRIPPAFHQTRWFAALCALALAAALWGLHRMRVRQVAARVRGRLDAQLHERERIARELHDTLLQGFHALMLRFQAATDRIPKEAPARPLMEAALDRADAVLIEGRQRVLALRLDDSQPLCAALTEAGEALCVYGSAGFCLTQDGTERPLREDAHDMFLRVGHEALANAFRHARASRIEVLLAYEDKQLRLRVADDGGGIAADVLSAGARPGHWGLTGMRERARQLGATLTIGPGAGGGTEVSLTLPAERAYADMPSEPASRRRFRFRRDRRCEP